MALLGLPFEAVAPPFFEEVTSHGPAEQQALTFAAGKACSCLPLCPDALILGSDTLISLEQEVMGKPVDMADAEAMLRRLAGRPHRIVTAVALVGPGSEVCAVRLATVLVTMKPLNEAALAAYLVTGDSLGKAGAYSIQGGGATRSERIWLLVSFGISGSVSTTRWSSPTILLSTSNLVSRANWSLIVNPFAPHGPPAPISTSTAKLPSSIRMSARLRRMARYRVTMASQIATMTRP